jgi:Predicted membrane protein (DUF2085)
MRDTTRRIVLIAAVLWCMAIAAAPILREPEIYLFFSRICHQDPARSWSLAGAPLPVCIRCASIYFGFLVALWIGARPNWKTLEFSIAATLAQFILALLIWDSPWIRSATGLALGAAAAPFVVRGIDDMIRGAARGTV